MKVNMDATNAGHEGSERGATGRSVLNRQPLPPGLVRLLAFLRPVHVVQPSEYFAVMLHARSRRTKDERRVGLFLGVTEKIRRARC